MLILMLTDYKNNSDCICLHAITTMNMNYQNYPYLNFCMNDLNLPYLNFYMNYQNLPLLEFVYEWSKFTPF